MFVFSVSFKFYSRKIILFTVMTYEVMVWFSEFL